MDMYEVLITALVLLMATRAFWAFLILGVVIATAIIALVSLVTFQFVSAFGFMALLLVELLFLGVFEA